MDSFEPVWKSMDEQVAKGWAPGFVGAISHRGEDHFHATGKLAFDRPEPMHVDTPFRIASLSKLVCGALTLQLVEAGVLGLEAEVTRWLPELAELRVLRNPEAALDDTEPLARPITVRHLLTNTGGAGLYMKGGPASARFKTLGLSPSVFPPRLGPDEFVKRLATMPLLHQPAEGWLYHTGADLLSILIARACQSPLSAVLTERIFGPLGMKTAAFSLPGGEGLPSQYSNTPSGLKEIDGPRGVWSAPPHMETLAGGLLCSVPDYLRFLRALAGGRLLRPSSLAQMTRAQLDETQLRWARDLMGEGHSWGFQVGVNTETREPWETCGSYGWTGGSGTCAQVDPARRLIGVIFSQRAMGGPNENFEYFWRPFAEATAE